jgi:glycosyltransferase involved in cell wall biosynthesis
MPKKNNQQSDLAFPYVACICPTYNRRKYLENLLYIFDYQEWPKHRRELILLDDSETTNQDIIDKFKKDNNINYIYLPERLNLGRKRNLLNELVYSKETRKQYGLSNDIMPEYVVCFDDDDYYPPCRIKEAIMKMKSTRNILCGSTVLHVFMTNYNTTYQFGPYGPRHCTNGTMAYHVSFVKDRAHYYQDDATKAEEKFFLKDFSEPMVQLNPDKVMLCISHNSNTFDKRRIANQGKKTQIKLKDLVKDKKLLNFYRQLIEETKDMAPPEPLEGIPQQNGIRLEDIESGKANVPVEVLEQLLSKNDPNMPQQARERIENIIKQRRGDLKNTQEINLNDLESGKSNVPIEVLEKILANNSNNTNMPQEIKDRLEKIINMRRNTDIRLEDIESGKVRLSQQNLQDLINSTRNNPNAPSDLLERLERVMERYKAENIKEVSIDDIINEKVEVPMEILEQISTGTTNEEIREKINLIIKKRKEI